MISDEVKAKLLPYQIKHVESVIHSIKNHNRQLDCSDTGTGKTYTTIAMCVTLGLKPLIICPKSVITSWKNVLKFFGKDYYGISNYESICNSKMFTEASKNEKVLCPYLNRVEVTTDQKKEKEKETSKTVVKKTMINKTQKEKKQINIGNKDDVAPDDDIKYTYVWKNLPHDCVIIFDEAHRCKNPRTLNSVLLYTLAKTTAKIVMLSATISDKFENFALCGFVLGLYSQIRNAKNWMLSVSKDCNNIFSGVHDQIYPEYAARMRIKDLGKLFPDNSISCNCYDMKNAKEIEEQYKLIEEEVIRLQINEDLSGCGLARILYCRMKIEMLKVPTYIEQAKKFIEEGASVAIFVNFTQSLQTIADELNTKCIIFGQQTREERDNAIDRFNNDLERIIVCNINSGGVGVSLHDLNGIYPRVSIISPGYSAQSIVQALGRIHRAGAKTAVRQRIIFCSNTVEEQICSNMRDKITNIAMLNDNDLGSYQIEGLIDDEYAIGIDQHKNLSEFDKLFLKINVLNIKKQRLEMELKDTENEIRQFETKMNNLII
jgi:superfamily II DNA or RNA helicase